MKKFRFLLIGCFFSFCAHAQVSPVHLTVWKDSAIGAIYNEATVTVAYGKPDANGYYKIYLSDSTGANEVPVTYSGWPSNRHQWAEEWSPDGQYLFCYVEKPVYAIEPGHTRIPEDAIPGYGAYTDIWLLKRDGSQAWQLTNFPNDYDHGVIHGAISQDGSLFTWTERIQRPDGIWNPNLLAGAYVFRVADVLYEPNPALTNIRTFQPGGLLAGGEVESISPDKSTLLIYSTFESQSIYNTPLYAIRMSDTLITKLTTESFSQAPTYNLSGTRIVYMTGKECDIFPFSLQGADWWMMHPDGSHKTRLTYMNVTNHPQSVNAYRLAGTLSFLSDREFLGGVMTFPFGLTGYTARVQIDTNLTSVNEANWNPKIGLFPNPASESVFVTVPAGMYDYMIRVYNIQGQVCLVHTSNPVLDVSALAAGEYIVELESAQGIVRTKLIVQ